jgi:hypothetical protein
MVCLDAEFSGVSRPASKHLPDPNQEAGGS